MKRGFVRKRGVTENTVTPRTWRRSGHQWKMVTGAIGRLARKFESLGY